MSNLDELFEKKLKEKRIKSQRECMHSNYFDYEYIAKQLGEQYKEQAIRLRKSWYKKAKKELEV